MPYFGPFLHVHASWWLFGSMQALFQSRPVQATGTLGRSRVLAGKNLITQAMKDQAQHVAQEAERKKEEERLVREEKLNEAAKKKEEMLKSRAEEKKK
jgi:hypothetical protein